MLFADFSVFAQAVCRLLQCLRHTTLSHLKVICFLDLFIPGWSHADLTDVFSPQFVVNNDSYH